MRDDDICSSFRSLLDRNFKPARDLNCLLCPFLTHRYENLISVKLSSKSGNMENQDGGSKMADQRWRPFWEGSLVLFFVD